MSIHVLSKDYVQTADATTNLEERDVIGNKTDAAAAGAVSATESLMAYSKQNVTNTEAAATSLSTIDAFHDVPVADVATNTVMRDVIGNKSDTVVGTSLYSKAVTILANVLSTMGSAGILSAKTAAALPQTNQSALFTVTGTVEILAIRGDVTVEIGAVANATKLVSNPTVGADVNLCATNDITGDTVGTMYSVTGIFADPMVATTSGAFESQANPITVTAGTIDVNCAGSDGGDGRVSWTVLYRVLSPGASVVSA